MTEPGKQISDVERTGVKSALKANQDALLAAIAAAGGRVLGEYQSAINGIKVEIDGGALAALQGLPNVETILPVEQMQPDNSTSPPSGLAHRA